MAKKEHVIDEKYLRRMPLKSRLLYNFKMDGEAWGTDATTKLLNDAGMKPTNRWLWVLRYYMMEMAINGMLDEIDHRVADPEFYDQEDVIDAKYRITDLGIERIDKVLRL